MLAPTMPETPRHDSRLAHEVAQFCLRHTPAEQASRASFPSSPLWAAAAATGTSLWLDTGDIDAARKLWTREFTALTTNNTLLNKEVQKGFYDALVPDCRRLLLAQGITDRQQLVQEIAFVLNAVHGQKLVRAFDADVSVELHTAVADDAEASYQYGKRFHAINPQRFIVKVPLTPAGLLAARRLSDDGVRLNFTLGFSARQNWLIAAVARPTWVNVFMGRVNAFLADNRLGDGKYAGEKATLASQRLLRRLAQEGGPKVRQIGASMRNGQQVQDLLGLDVFTIPTAAAAEFVQAAPAPATLRDRTAEDPQVTFAAGVDARQLRLDCFWQVEPAFGRAVAAVAQLDPRSHTADDVRRTLAAHGAADLFPHCDAEERHRLAAEGKIPVLATWRERVLASTASWDGLLTAAALASFAADQQALDARIAGLL